MAAVVKVGVVSAPLKTIVPVVLVRTTPLPVVTAPVKVVPPELVMVRVASVVPLPIAPFILIAPAVLKTRDSVLACVPLIELALLNVITPLLVLVKLVSAPNVTAPV